MMRTAALVALLVLSTSMSCSRSDPEPRAARVAPGGAAGQPASGNAGPEKWDAAGRVPCSVDRDTFERTCGYRALRNPEEKKADLWIRNLAKGKAEYRVLHYADGTFTGNDDSKISAQREDAGWAVGVDGKEFYFIPDRLLGGGGGGTADGRG